MPKELSDGIAIVQLAVEMDSSGKDPKEALDLYQKAIPMILKGLQLPSVAPAMRAHIQAKAAEYLDRAENLKKQILESEQSMPLLQEAAALSERATAAEASGAPEEAQALLTQCLELEIKAMKMDPSNEWLRKNVEEHMSRAEQLRVVAQHRQAQRERLTLEAPLLRGRSLSDEAKAAAAHGDNHRSYTLYLEAIEALLSLQGGPLWSAEVEVLVRADMVAAEAPTRASNPRPYLTRSPKRAKFLPWHEM